jgi:hypothetical protein
MLICPVDLEKTVDALVCTMVLQRKNVSSMASQKKVCMMSPFTLLKFDGKFVFDFVQLVNFVFLWPRA